MLIGTYGSETLLIRQQRIASPLEVADCYHSPMDIRSIRQNNLRYALLEAGSTAKLAALAELNEKYLKQILAGFQGVNDKTPRKLGHAAARAIEKGLSKDHGWMDAPHPDLWAALPSDEQVYKLSRAPAESGKKAATVLIRQFETGGSMGGGLELRDQPGVIESWQVSQEWLQKNVRGFSAAANLCIVTGFGDSMRPMFNPGDPLLVDTAVKTADYDAVYFFRVGNEGFIKRLQRIPTEDGLVLRAKSENPLYDSWDIRNGMDFQVFGRVLKVWRSEDY